MVGVMGLWNQMAYKQTVVQSYRGLLLRFRPFYNLGLRLIDARPLPSPGEPLQFAYASFICIANNQPKIFRALLQYVYNMAIERNFAYLMVGLAENDPLLAVAQQYWYIPYYSRLYTVCWDHDKDWANKLDNRIPYIEIAAL